VEPEYWHLAVIGAVIALLVWGFRTARRTTLVVCAAVLTALSGFLLYTLVLEEPFLDSDLNSRLETGAMIGIPALLAVAFGFFAIRQRSPRS
jgi:hypothetical protein